MQRTQRGSGSAERHGPHESTEILVIGAQQGLSAHRAASFPPRSTGAKLSKSSPSPIVGSGVWPTTLAVVPVTFSR
ncbi:hypothetical protein ACWD25_01990 [Streptomyces sp. NPDC002920]